MNSGELDFLVLDTPSHSGMGLYGEDIDVTFDTSHGISSSAGVMLDDAESLTTYSDHSPGNSSPFSPPSSSSDTLSTPAGFDQAMESHFGFSQGYQTVFAPGPPVHPHYRAGYAAAIASSYPELHGTISPPSSTATSPTPAKGKSGGRDGVKAASKAKTSSAAACRAGKGSAQKQQPGFDTQQQFQQFALQSPAVHVPYNLGTPPPAQTHQQPHPQPGQFYTFTASPSEPTPASLTQKKKPAAPKKAAAAPTQQQLTFEFVTEMPYTAAKQKKGKQASAAPLTATAPASARPIQQQPAYPPAVARDPVKQELVTPSPPSASNFSSPNMSSLITPPLSDHDNASHSSHSSSGSENGDPLEISPSESPVPTFRAPGGVLEMDTLFNDEDEDEDDNEEDEDLDGGKPHRVTVTTTTGASSKPLFDSFKIRGAPSAGVHRSSSAQVAEVKEEEDEEDDPQDKMQRHKKSERRRREKVNDSISTLRTIVPTLHAVLKPSKGAILLKTVEFVTRIQHKHTEVTRQLGEANEKIAMQQNYINLLVRRLAENSIPVPGSPEDSRRGTQPPPHPTSTQYFVQDAGRTMVLMAALLFFWYAPWHIPTLQGGQSATQLLDVTSGRSLLSTPSAVFELEGWLMFFVWMFVRWVVMTTLLTIAMFSDQLYCSPELKQSQESVHELNRLSRECLADGNFVKANRLTNEALLLLQRPIPNSSFDIFFGIIYQVGRQVAHRVYVGRFVDRLLLLMNGQVGYATHLKDTYLNLSLQAHYLPSYNKWRHLYILLCAINLAEITDDPKSEELVQAYAALAYLVTVHSRAFEVFARIYMFLANKLISRQHLESARFGQFHIIVAYRHLLSGNFDQAFDSLQKAMDTHHSFGLSHHYRESLMMKAWILHVLGSPHESLEAFREIYDSGSRDGDRDSRLWGLVGQVGNLMHLGETDKAFEWLQVYAALLEEPQPQSSQPAIASSHQQLFLLGFKASLHLREGHEERALEVANQALEFLKANAHDGMPHNVLPLQKILDVHLALLEKFQHQEGDHAAEMVRTLEALCREDLELMQRSIVLFSLMRPLYHLYAGRFGYLTTGNLTRATDCFQQCEDSSRRFGLRHLVGLCQLEWARVMPLDSVARTDRLEEALAIFVDIEALYEEQLTRQELRRKEGEDLVARVIHENYQDLE